MMFISMAMVLVSTLCLLDLLVMSGIVGGATLFAIGDDCSRLPTPISA
ncbi:hypothetical protein [Nonomuraea aridisoli]|nr:hypothetical protein [Nonomuraea aridisoli]